MIFPEIFRQGDRIAVIASSSPLPDNDTVSPQMVAGAIEKLGYTPQIGASVTYGTDKKYSAAPARIKACEINSAFADPDIKGIWILRGGSTGSEILPLLDAEMIKRNPKPVIGFSDVTSLHTFLQNNCGIVSFHGPVAKQLALADRYTGYTAERLYKALNMKDSLIFENPIGKPLRTVNAGNAEGILTGGNLSVICSLQGTPYSINAKGKTLFLEDVGEAVYRIDRMLNQLKSGGVFDQVNAVLLGDFTNCRNHYTEKYDIHCLLKDFFSQFSFPVISGLSAGHIPDNSTLPLGTVCRINNEHIVFYRK